MPFVYSAAAMLNPEILELLVCPESHQKIVPAEQSLVDELGLVHLRHQMAHPLVIL